MTRHKIPVRFTGQHFTIDEVLISDSIKYASINPNDVILDIGAGKGYLTVHLIKYTNTVIAIEKDYKLVKILRRKFSKNQNVEIFKCDFRDFKLPETPFKAVSNIPYGITSEILKILMFDSVKYFEGGSLVMQLEAAKKLLSPQIHNPLVIFYHSTYNIQLQYEISPSSFMPPPTVQSALLKIEKRSDSFAFEQNEKYLAFISYLLRRPDLTMLGALKSIFRKSQIKVLSKKFGIKLSASIGYMTPGQWKSCYLEMLEIVPVRHHPKVMN